MTSSFMTILGVITAGIATVSASLPNDAPLWLQVIIAGLNAALAMYMGKTHSGTK